MSGTSLGLDARRKSELSFVSHAHADHIARHERVIATAPTLKMMSHRLGALSAALPVPYNRPFELGPLHIELLPAGHMLGSAQLRVIRGDGQRIVYTGDLNLVPSLTAEPAQVAECDTLIIESTFGHPRFSFPPKDRVLREVEQRIRFQLERGVTPVLLCYPFGKSQEAMKHLGEEGFQLRAHASIFAVTQLYAECGVSIPSVRRYDPDAPPSPDEVLVFPPNLSRSPTLTRRSPRASAVLTGWAIEPGTARRYGADCSFPLSDHADCQALIDYTKATGASEVLTHHGFADELAKELRAQGIDARRVGLPKQLELF